MDVGFLVQFTDGGWKYLATPQGFCDVLHPAHGYSSQVHLNEGLFRAAFPPVTPLYNGGLEGGPLGFGHLEGDIPRCGGEITAVVTAAVAPPLCIALVPGCLVSLSASISSSSLEGFLYAAPHKFLELTLEHLFI